MCLLYSIRACLCALIQAFMMLLRLSPCGNVVGELICVILQCRCWNDDQLLTVLHPHDDYFVLLAVSEAIRVQRLQQHVVLDTLSDGIHLLASTYMWSIVFTGSLSSPVYQIVLCCLLPVCSGGTHVMKPLFPWLSESLVGRDDSNIVSIRFLVRLSAWLCSYTVGRIVFASLCIWLISAGALLMWW